jgi:hypothetical protein
MRLTSKPVRQEKDGLGLCSLRTRMKISLATMLRVVFLFEVMMMVMLWSTGGDGNLERDEECA